LLPAVEGVLDLAGALGVHERHPAGVDAGGTDVLESGIHEPVHEGVAQTQNVDRSLGQGACGKGPAMIEHGP
jgi:hypothetical protein